MATGDPHWPYQCWCGANHHDETYQQGFEAGQRSSGIHLMPTVEQLAQASPDHWEEGRLGSGMTAEHKANHHELYCMVDGRKWHGRLKEVIEGGK